MTDLERDPTAFLHETMPFCATLGMRALALRPDEVRLALDWAPGLCTTNGLLHGGAVMALADAAGGACAFLNLPEGAAGTSTIESKTNFLGALRAGALTADAKALHVGSTTIVVETELRDDEGRLAAKVTQTQMVLRPRG
ncbi:MAG: PaaI family thioesterase [Acidimicrobiales bacterium]